MKIAVLQDDQNVIDRINDKIGTIHELTFFQDQYEFIDLSCNFDLVLLDKKFINKDIIKHLGNVEIGVINNQGTFDFDDKQISIVLDDQGINNIEEKLKYFETKIRIKNLVSLEEQSYNNIQKITLKADFFKQKQKETEEFLRKIIKNYYYIQNIDGICVIEIRDVIRITEREEIFKELENTDYKICVYYAFNNVSSLHLGILVELWKKIQKHNGKLVYWNKQSSVHIENVLKLCRLENLIPILNSFEEVKNKLK